MSRSAALRALGTSAVVVVAEPGALPAARRAAAARAGRDRPRLQPLPSRLGARRAQRRRRLGCAGEPAPLRGRRGRAARSRGRRAASSTRPSAGRCGSPATTGPSSSCASATATASGRGSSSSGAGARSSSTARAARSGCQGVELDLGATAKALAADRAALAASRAAGTGVLISLGGDVAVAGPAPAPGWPVRIAEDHAAPLDAPGPTVSIRSGGLATSGTAVRRWRAGDVELHHIVDPRTGRPAETPWTALTVAAASCVDANAASTAAVVLGEAAAEWLAERRLPARLQGEDGTVVCTGGWPEDAW